MNLIILTLSFTISGFTPTERFGKNRNEFDVSNEPKFLSIFSHGSSKEGSCLGLGLAWVLTVKVEVWALDVGGSLIRSRSRLSITVLFWVVSLSIALTLALSSLSLLLESVSSLIKKSLSVSSSSRPKSLVASSSNTSVKAIADSVVRRGCFFGCWPSIVWNVLSYGKFCQQTNRCKFFYFYIKNESKTTKFSPKT